MKIKVVWKLISKRGQPASVQLVSTKCVIDTLVVHFVKEKTKHDIIDRIFVKLLNNTIRRRIANAVAEYLQLKVTQVDEQINQFFLNRPLDQLKEKADAALKRSMETRESKRSLEGGSSAEIPVSSRLPASSTKPYSTSSTEEPLTRPATVTESRAPVLTEQVKKTTV